MNDEDSKDERIDSYDRDINAIVKDMHECQTTIDGIRSSIRKISLDYSEAPAPLKLCCDATDTLLREAVHVIALGESQLGQIRYWQSKLTAKMEG
jgi:hypothetical protein